MAYSYGWKAQVMMLEDYRPQMQALRLRQRQLQNLPLDQLSKTKVLEKVHFEG